jgi:hypothetical protein
MIAPIRGFIPSLDQRLTIASKSGTGRKDRSKAGRKADNLRRLTPA